MSFGVRSKAFLLSTVALLVVALSPQVHAPATAQEQDTDAKHFDTSEPAGPVGQIIPLTALGKSAVGLEVREVQKRLLPLQLKTPGKIEAIPNHEFAQHSPVAGRISQVLVNLGDIVKQGQILLYIESPDLNRTAAEITQSKQDLEAQIATQTALLSDEVQQAQARIDLAKENYRRDAKLFEEKIGSEKQMQTSLADLEVAKSQFKTAKEKQDLTIKALRTKLRLTMEPLRQRLQMLGESDESIEEMLRSGQTISNAPVRSARAGVITVVNASPGQSIDPSVKLFTVSDLNRVWATAQVYEDDMGRIKLGQKVMVRVPAFRSDVFQGNLDFIGNSVDPRTRTLPVRAEIANPNIRLKPDMYADLIIQMGTPTMAVLMPSDAVVERSGHSIVFAEVQGGFQPIRVDVGRNFGDFVEIVDGVTPGHRVVTRGAFQLAAQMLKSSGNEDLFQQATEGERDYEKKADEDKGSQLPGLNLPIVLVGLIVAFVGGFGASAIFARSHQHHDNVPRPRRSEPTEEGEEGTESGIKPARREK